MGLSVDICKSFNGFTLDVKFSVEKGTIGFLGSSGSGKSMTLRCIAGLVIPDKGRIVLNDRVLFDSEKGINVSVQERNTGFLFQNYALFPNFTVRENIAFGLKKLSKKEQAVRIEEKLEMMQLGELQNRYPSQLSGGQQQRTALARALVTEPECLLLDEPFSALDNHIRSRLEKELLETIESYSGITVYVTHNLEECYRISKEIVVMERGKAAAFGSRDEIFLNPPNVKAARLTGCRNFSKVKQVSSDYVEAIDWGCQFKSTDLLEKIDNYDFIGVRDHEIKILGNINTEYTEYTEDNMLPCWLAQVIETPYKVTLYLNLKNPPENFGDYHIQT
ncbi:MAG: sulfate/molybdate ABC transporter ATP-binding protein, partial [Eubacteriales bacterium]